MLPFRQASKIIEDLPLKREHIISAELAGKFIFSNCILDRARFTTNLFLYYAYRDTLFYIQQLFNIHYTKC